MSSYVNSINIFASSSLMELLESAPQNKTIADNLCIAWSKINSPKYKKIICAISGGSDSDILLDICIRCDKDCKIEYVWFDTGLEYQATKDHLEYLEKKYQIKITRIKAIKSIPRSCKEYGQPFLNKRASEYMMRLQKVGFQWEDEDFMTLVRRYCKNPTPEKSEKFDRYYEFTGKYPKGWVLLEGEWWRGVISPLKWWCNQSFKGSQCNIENNRYLKEFIMQNPPKLKIANKCCKYAKKDVSKEYIKEHGFDLSISGVRKAEGGVRAQAYKNCFTENSGECDAYRGIFWYTNEDKRQYAEHYKIEHSKCYSEYGLCRTGCVGCPCGRDPEKELEIVEQYEPKLYAAVTNVFSDSYAYEKEYRKFAKKMRAERNLKKKNPQICFDAFEQMTIFDYITA